ncbi:bifunctional adenosylcobinamide kinase/adenosylcobinamide-phosphate guanylyltransferase [Brevibacillus sp. AY1]|uniref:bifunctional adenosylcobinamide kinase/adenosylcobinamide-phosphate guanylyltransferase n=1 Tax=Brevibacillus sp. AY1 TaxID=2807621 RepID=UPI002454EB68|nr:bifunctional adenosylcobinamide kinase/adenosylcobinamide-phosphate guanylyltransferase [Brevibacillus sp. AY1]MDH4618993.1 bifunctional adenosylcobinamide kinase/adenosylcobinamide-phosphate guanylyltransferase [Brevibacillus sp. AY1]
MSLILVTGGVRSGKSGFAEELASETGKRVLYVATGEAKDEEMRNRIELHQARRPAEWGCVEIPQYLSHSIQAAKEYEVVLLDCLSTWVSNWLMAVPEEKWRNDAITQEIYQEAKAWLDGLAAAPQTVIAVTSEVGLGGVAMNKLGRWFADVLGDVNQMTARRADTVYAVFSGIPWRIKG